MKKMVSLFVMLILLFSSISFAALSSDLTPPSKLSEGKEAEEEQPFLQHTYTSTAKK